MLEPQSFFDLADFPYADIFADTGFVWEALGRLKDYINTNVGEPLVHERLGSGIPLAEPLILHNGSLAGAEGCRLVCDDVTKGKLAVYRHGQRLAGASVIMAGVVLLGNRIKIGRGVLIESGALIKEPAIIGDSSEVRQGAYLRGYCLIGRRCVVGHTTEVKHSIFLNDAKAGHFAYIGDSILGTAVNLGAGTKLANLRFIRGEVMVKTPDGAINSGLRKFGAIFGDRTQTGCNAVTSPGTVIGRAGIIMPNTTVPSGCHPAGSLIK
ncbi:bifunctional protein GlmU [bacterium BMS3Abin13]|nr:bifunctional protein GlmU [bacterium BMS3Abin13]